MKGMLVYKMYRAASFSLSPLLHLHIRWRKLRGLEHPTRWPERFAYPSMSRPAGPLIWFHAVSLGEGLAAIPVIKQCVQWRPDLNILMTTTTFSAFEVLKDQLPISVIYQFSPFDTPTVMDTFLAYWRPNVIILIESELWPNLIVSASRIGIALVLLNARVSEKSFKKWSSPVLLPLISLMLSKFSLIVPLSAMQAINFQLLQAPPFIINFAGDLKYAVREHGAAEPVVQNIEDLKSQLCDRKVWLAASIHRGEEKVMLQIHQILMQMDHNLLTIIVPRHPQHGQEIAQKCQEEGQNVLLRSQYDKILPGTNIYVVDTLGELKHLYKLSPIAIIGGSFLPGLAGHNISEAAAAGCAVLTGYHVGHFSHMLQEMRLLNPLSVLQVSGKSELAEAIIMLFNDPEVLEARRTAAREAVRCLSNGVVANVWNLLYFHVLRQALS